MKDLLMIFILAGAFLLFYGFLAWSGRVVGESGGEGK
ncbi:hypothetical protein J2Z66_001555 [Paenibacillus eucommiae]|uniref:Uncharacterized protein n=1 Tax=Paenibacillus eucommiae TaxID=1355755 RepID=A0ABS4IQW6_9BACL|nr:hypothetical protein [Paenibacillus eucommiae]